MASTARPTWVKYVRDVRADSAGRNTPSALEVCTTLDELRAKQKPTTTSSSGPGGSTLENAG